MLKHKSLFLGLMAVLVAGFALGSEAIPNWPAPATWTPTRSDGVHALADVTPPIPFVGVTPCRIWDTRGNGFVGQYGPPAIAANTQRTFTIVGQCGIPAGALAVSFNIGALNVGAAGDLRVFPAGGAVPNVSTLNYNANTPNIANAAVVPLGAGGAITLQADAVAIDSIGDVNGYYARTINASEYFGVVGNWPGGGVVFGANANTTGGSSGVHGLESATTGVVFGVTAESDSTTDGAAGIRGRDLAGAGTVYGVLGQSNNVSHSSGLRGADATGVVSPGNIYSFSTGVVGDGQNGVAGETSTASGWGVLGVAQDSTGANTAVGIVAQGGDAFRAFLGAYAGAMPSLTISPHPSNASQIISYTPLTGNEAGTYFRGTAQTTDREFVINVPEDFRMVTDSEGLTVQLTPVGASATMYVVSEDLNQIVVRSSRDVKFHYLVQGIREGYKGYNPVQDAMEHAIFLPQAPDGLMQSAWPDYIKQRLIANGTYNPDGKINMQTAERAGWAKLWRQREAEEKAAAEKNAAARNPMQ